MKKLFAFLAAVCVSTGAVYAAGGDPSESGVPTSPLKIWSSGVGGGLLYSLNDDLKGTPGKSLGEVVWMNSFDFTDNFALFADVNWYMADSGAANFGVDLGGDCMLSDGRVKPFVGLGIGARYYDKLNGIEGKDGGTMGGSALVRVGVALELTETIEVRVRVPFQFAVIGEVNDMRVGAEVGVMFFSNFRNIRKLGY